MTDDELKKLVQLMASPEAKAIIERGRGLSPEKLQAEWTALVLEDEVDSDRRILFDEVFKAFMARWVH